MQNSSRQKLRMNIDDPRLCSHVSLESIQLKKNAWTKIKEDVSTFKYTSDFHFERMVVHTEEIILKEQCYRFGDKLGMQTNITVSHDD